MKKNLPFITLWILFACMSFWKVAIISSIDMWTILEVISVVLSIWILVKSKLPSKKYILYSILFMILSTVAYLGYQMNPLILIFGLKAGVPTLLSCLAVFSVMEKEGGFQLITKGKKWAILVTILIGLGVGACLAAINTYMSGQIMGLQFSFRKLLVCFNTAIFEEMACRAIFMAYCIYYSRKEKMNWFQILTMYFMMCMPHAISHNYPLAETLFLCVVFGIPLAILQKKRDIISAMVCHGFIDAVRFTLFGL